MCTSALRTSGAVALPYPPCCHTLPLLLLPSTRARIFFCHLCQHPGMLLPIFPEFPCPFSDLGGGRKVGVFWQAFL
ncbi:hypothetical protein C8R46DRAFT_1146252 [Mycena filopes]|nr:hypothetical protein C8R46DRAFT_1146252 [Mycena filopes]